MYKNIYQEARITANITQEKLAEKLNLSVKSIQDYENNKTIPSNDIAELIGKICNDADLYHNHLSIKSNGYIPYLEGENLSNLAIKLFLQYKDMEIAKEDFMEIAKDGRIDEYERPYFEQIKKEAWETIEICFGIVNQEIG